MCVFQSLPATFFFGLETKEFRTISGATFVSRLSQWIDPGHDLKFVGVFFWGWAAHVLEKKRHIRFTPVDSTRICNKFRTFNRFCIYTDSLQILRFVDDAIFFPNMTHSYQGKTLIHSNALKIAPWRFPWILVMRIQLAVHCSRIPVDIHIVADGFFCWKISMLFGCGFPSLPGQAVNAFMGKLAPQWWGWMAGKKHKKTKINAWNQKMIVCKKEFLKKHGADFQVEYVKLQAILPLIDGLLWGQFLGKPRSFVNVLKVVFHPGNWRSIDRYSR